MKIIIAITGASGSIYAYNLLEHINKLSIKDLACDLIFSESGKKVWNYELQNRSIKSLKFKTYEPDDFFAPPASGSAGYDAMIICPCSMGTLSKIANGISDNLICRAADVMLKERRKLVLVIREAPYNLIHINNMKQVTEAGAVIHPASPHFYNHPKTINQVTETVTHRLLEYIGLDSGLKKWGDNAIES